MKLEQAQEIAERVKAELAPHCERIEIAGSIRRRKAEVGDIEIVAIPKQVNGGLFGDEPERDPGFICTVGQWRKVRGSVSNGRYMQRLLPDGIALDLFTATADNWGLIYAIRTGSAEYSHRVLATGWVRNGYKSVDGILTRDGILVSTPEETDLFRLAGVTWIEPELRM